MNSVIIQGVSKVVNESKLQFLGAHRMDRNELYGIESRILGDFLKYMNEHNRIKREKVGQGEREMTGRKRTNEISIERHRGRESRCPEQLHTPETKNRIKKKDTADVTRKGHTNTALRRRKLQNECF
jgi:hypothetical protein